MSSRKSGQAGHFWELEEWMEAHDVSVRELALLLGCGRSVVGRLLCGQFSRIDERLQKKLRTVTRNAIAEPQWAAFTARRLADRSEVAA